jgi:hypothetical protein
MTISVLLKDLSTLDQFEVLMRADRMFLVGRYYGGDLTIDEFMELTYKRETGHAK